MSSYSDKETDKKLKALEKRIASEYKEAYEEMKAKATAYFEKLDDRYKAEYEKYLNGAYTEAEFKAWYKTQVERGHGYDQMAEELAERVSGANIVASAYINDTTPSIFSLNQMYEAYTISNGSEYQYSNWHLYDEQTVRNLMLEERNVLEFKTTSINPTRDYNWNKNLIRKATTSAILQGKSVDELADAYYDVMKRNKSSALRNARTSVTSAQNAGRLKTYERASELGIEVKKEWVCTHDARTRDSHADLDGEIVPYNETFSNGLMFPADADGKPAEVYNCRCTMVVNLPKFDRDEKRYTYGDWVEEQKKLQTVPKNEREARRMRATSRAVQRWDKRHGITNSDILTKGTKEKTDKPVVILKPTDKTADLLMEMYENHRTANGLNLVPINNVDPKQFEVKLGKISDETVTALNNTLSRLSQKYDTTLTKVRVMTKDEYVGKGNAFAFVFHNYEIDDSTLVFNPAKVKDYKELSARLEELIKKGYAVNIPLSNAGEYVFTHEFAHTLIDTGTQLNKKRNWAKADYEKIKKARRELTEVYTDYMSEIEKLTKTANEAELNFLNYFDLESAEKARAIHKEIEKIKISKYSMENADELMAEAFTLAQFTEVDNPYVIKIMGIINKYFRR